MNNNTHNAEGVGILGWVFLIFLTLKLTGHITWSWWWVTAPLWAVPALLLGLLGLWLLFAVVKLIVLAIWPEK